MRQLSQYGAGTTHLFKKHRAKLGLRRFTLKEPYFEVLWGIVMTPFRLVLGQSRLERLWPVFEVLAMSSYIVGKLRASLRLRVWNV